MITVLIEGVWGDAQFFNERDPRGDRVYIRPDDFNESTRRRIAREVAGIGELWRRRLELASGAAALDGGSSPFTVDARGRPLLPTEGDDRGTYPL